MDIDYLLMFIAVNVLFAFIVGLFAKRKGRNVSLWAIAGLLTGVIALIGLAFFHKMKDISEDKMQGSIMYEKIFCGIMIALGVLKILVQFSQISS